MLKVLFNLVITLRRGLSSDNLDERIFAFQTIDYESTKAVSDDDKSELEDLGEVVSLLLNVQPAHPEKSSDIIK